MYGKYLLRVKWLKAVGQLERRREGANILNPMLDNAEISSEEEFDADSDFDSE